MADIWYDVDAALSEVPVNLMPLLDDTDFKSIEADVNFDAAGLSLIWHFVTTAGAYTQTAVTPTDTGGAYDWVEQGNGMFTIEIPASGGATINNDTEGFGWFTGVATGILPWRGPVCGFRAASLNNALVDGGDVLDVSVTEIGGVAQSATDLKDFADTGYDPSTHKVAGVVTADALTANNDKTGYGLADDAITAAKFDESTAFPLASADSGATAVARTGADSDTLETLSDEIAAAKTVVDTIAVDVAGLDGEAMRGTDDAALATAMATAQLDLDTITGADGATLATLQGNYAPAKAGDEMDLVDVPNATAVTAIQDGLATTTELAKVPKSDGTTTWNATALASVNAEVVDCLSTDTYAEPAQGAPGATISLAAKIGYVYKAWRNKKTQTADTKSIFNDDASTVDHKCTVSDDATTYTETEMTTGA